MTTVGYIVAAVAAVIALLIGFLVGIQYRKKVAEKEISSAEDEARRIINEAIKSSESKKREALLEAKEEILRNRAEYEKEVKERRADLQKQERRLQQKEENIDRKTDAIEKKEEALAEKHEALLREQDEIKLIKRSQTEMLERISGFTAEQAKEYLIRQVESEVTHETAMKIKEIEARAKDEADQRAREIVATAIQRCAADHVAEITVSVVPLPNDEMKGRIIGREGRNIRTIETLTGVAAGVVATACGIYVIRHPLALATVMGYCLGVYLAVQGISTLYDALRLHKARHECGREILLGIIMLSGGILLLCFPLTSSRVVMMVLGVALAVIGVLQLVLRIRERQFPELHTGRPDIIDADE